jgi:lipid-binding SYLF domain-containing protein
MEVRCILKLIKVSCLGGWSAPSAIALGGIGGGFEIGLDLTDFVIILNSQHAVQSFSKGGICIHVCLLLLIGMRKRHAWRQLLGSVSRCDECLRVTVLAVAAGPLGRSLEADVAVRNPTAFFTYSKSRGLYAGVSLVGSALIERKSANQK